MFEELCPLSPANFFAVGVNINHLDEKKGDAFSKKYLLPALSLFHDTLSFAEVFLAWSEKGILCSIDSREPYSELSFPDFRKGDSVELFFDTRDVKTTGFVTKFCHHFCFLPESFEVEKESVQSLELTRFRGDDSHPLADPSLFFVETTKQKRGYTMKIFIPREALFGYDPLQFNRLGFTYRINRAGKDPQFFSMSGDAIVIETQPSFWASLTMVKE